MSELEETELREWVDKAQLSQLVAALGSAVDRGDRDRIAACYAEDSFDDHGLFQGSGAEFADFMSHPRPLTGYHHLLGQSLFEVAGDEAWGETWFLFHGAFHPGGAAATGTGVVLEGWGRYIDYFVRTPAGWKVKYRRVVPDRVPAGDDLSAYAPSRRDRTDPSYERRRGPVS